MRKPATIAFLSALVLAFSFGYALTHKSEVAPVALVSGMDVIAMHAETGPLPIESWDPF